MQLWIENSSGSHGGEGWELGTCVWSPSHNRRGVTSQYGIMSMADVGDVVINCLDGEITGVSEVATLAKETSRRPPLPAQWEYATSFFRFELRNFRRFSESASLREVASKYYTELRDDITLNSPKYYLYSYHRPGLFAPDGKIVLSQGRFLARGTPTLAMCFASVMSPRDAKAFKQRIMQYLDQQHDLQPQPSGVKVKTV